MYTRTVASWKRSLIVLRDSFDCDEDNSYHMFIVFLVLLMGANNAQPNFEKSQGDKEP